MRGGRIWTLRSTNKIFSNMKIRFAKKVEAGSVLVVDVGEAGAEAVLVLWLDGRVQGVVVYQLEVVPAVAPLGREA
jgi:hypothetical protein